MRVGRAPAIAAREGPRPEWIIRFRLFVRVTLRAPIPRLLVKDSASSSRRLAAVECGVSPSRGFPFFQDEPTHSTMVASPWPTPTQSVARP